MRFTILVGLMLALLLLAGCLGETPAPSAGANNSTPASGSHANASTPTSGALSNPSPSTPSNASAPANSSTPSTANSSSSSSSNDSTQVNNMTKTNPIVVFQTTKGTFSAEIFVAEAPITGTNFMKLVSSGFYDGLTFHRVEPGFVVQGGDPKGDGTGGSSETIPLEIKPNLKHHLGTLAMARASNPNSASSQFYVVTGEASFLDGSYAVFGEVQGDGMSVVNQLKVGDRMLKVYEKK